MPTPELNLPPVERVVAYTPRQGDTVVLKIDDAHNATPEGIGRLKKAAEQFFGEGIKVMVLGGADFVGVIETARAAS